MDWNKAKNIILILLIALNVCLAALVYVNRPKYEMSTERETAVREVLARNRIILRVPIPRAYEPMAQLLLEPPSYDSDSFIALFFGEGASVTRTAEFDKTIFSGGEGRTLTFTAGRVIFENPGGTGALDFTRAAAEELCNGIVRQNEDLLPGFGLDSPQGIETKSGYRLEYRQTFENCLVYANYAAFTLTEKGVVRTEFAYKKPLGFEKEKREIIPPDEALFSLMQRLLNMYENRETVIYRIDMAYYQEEAAEDAAAEDAAVLVAAPCYRFWAEGVGAPYIVNAYTGVVE